MPLSYEIRQKLSQLLRQAQKRLKKKEFRKKIEEILEKLGLKYGESVPCDNPNCHNNVSYHALPFRESLHDGKNLCNHCARCHYCGRYNCDCIIEGYPYPELW